MTGFEVAYHVGRSQGLTRDEAVAFARKVVVDGRSDLIEPARFCGTASGLPPEP